MRHIHDLEPVIAHGFERRDALANAINQDFAAATRNRAQPGGFEIGDDRLKRLVEDFAEMDEFARTESVNVDLRELAFEMR